MAAGALARRRPACPNRVAAVYLELAVLVRALQGLSDSARVDAPPDASSLWAGLFDLRDTLLGSTVDARSRRARASDTLAEPPVRGRGACVSPSVPEPFDHGRRQRQPRPRRARRAAAAAGRDGHRRELRARPRRQGREPGRRGGPARAPTCAGLRGRPRRLRRRGAAARGAARARRARGSTRRPASRSSSSTRAGRTRSSSPRARTPAEGVRAAAERRRACQLEVPDEAVLGAWEQADGLFCLNAAPARPIDVDADLTVVNRYELEALRRRDGLIAVTLGAEGACCSRTGRRSRAPSRRASTPSTAPPPATRSRRACSSPARGARPRGGAAPRLRRRRARRLTLRRPAVPADRRRDRRAYSRQ